MSLLSNYINGTPTPLALKGELFESLPADEQPIEAEGKCSVRGFKQSCVCELNVLTRSIDDQREREQHAAGCTILSQKVQHCM